MPVYLFLGDWCHHVRRAPLGRGEVALWRAKTHSLVTRVFYLEA
jgi:hypothetical protein